MKKLRERLEDNPDNPHLIIYEQGKGYRYVGS
jgi:DNA-binding response OmpR family regulator